MLRRMLSKVSLDSGMDSGLAKMSSRVLKTFTTAM